MIEMVILFKDVPRKDSCEHNPCGCRYQRKPGCPEGKVCCSCRGCWRENYCSESCGINYEVPAICPERRLF